MNIDCISKNSCADKNICSKDGDVKIHCLGENTCSRLNSCLTQSPSTSLSMEPTASVVQEVEADDSVSLVFVGYSIMLILMVSINN